LIGYIYIHFYLMCYDTLVIPMIVDCINWLYIYVHFYLMCYDTLVIPMIVDCIDWLYICSFLFSVLRHTCHSDDCRLY